MSIKFISPKKSVNSAFLKLPVPVEKMEDFKLSLKALYGKRDPKKDEEYHKNELQAFLKKIFDPAYLVQVKRPIDLAIYNGNDANAKPAVIIEMKSPTNLSEMFSEQHPNTKALQELVYYFLLEYVHFGNREIKHLVISNFDEYYFFDVKDFIRFFANSSKPIYKQFLMFVSKQTSGNKTSDFYNEIAKPAIDDFLKSCDISVVHFSLEDAVKAVEKNDDKKLVALYKMLSPEGLLAKPFANDSNSLDRNFYAELLHIIGLEEVKEDKGGKKVIQRKKPANRDKASLLESAIYQLEIKEPDENKCEEIALRLCITWINRLLFLKLVESQILMYQKGDASYRFMSSDKIKGFDELNIFFFKVLGKKVDDRDAEVKAKYPNVPYLNSSLFEPTEDESKLMIGNLLDNNLEIFSKTVLKDERGKRAKGTLPNLEYIFKFLDAYNFASDAQGGVTSTSKTLINASVLGLIFEKINGYKDGSFFTPGFITDYMARDVLERTVVQKFNEVKGWDCKNLREIEDNIGKDDVPEANKIVDEIRIADVAVGSGHFLVSALNRMLAIKSELNIFCDAEGNRINKKKWELKVDNDELSVIDDDGEPFEYKPGNETLQRIQEALFNEKRRIIENCLFGVDLNPNSVNICRLRLWIELLKNAYYTKESGYKQLQTLPNIDINIKVGDSLLSQYPVHEGHVIADYLSAEEKSDRKKNSLKNALVEYRQCVYDYKLGGTQNTKVALRQKIAGLKSRIVESGSLELFEEYANNADHSIDFSNSLEWMFEFPEILDDEGRFTGFDAIIGNPPYVQLQSMGEMSDVYSKRDYSCYNKSADLYCLFVERAYSLLKKNGYFSFIMPNKWMLVDYGKELRQFMSQTSLKKILNFGDVQIFKDATTYTCIFVSQKSNEKNSVQAISLSIDKYSGNFSKDVSKLIDLSPDSFGEAEWNITNPVIEKVLQKMSVGTPLRDMPISIYAGVKAGCIDAFYIDEQIKMKLIEEDAKSEEVIKPLLRGRDINAWYTGKNEKYLINSYSKNKENNTEGVNVDLYPSIKKHLDLFYDKLVKRSDKSDTPYNLRKCAYLEAFSKPKIIFPNITSVFPFTYDENGVYPNDNNFFIVEKENAIANEAECHPERSVSVVEGSLLKALLAIFNSSLCKFWIWHNCPVLNGGTRKLQIAYFENLRIPLDNAELLQQLATLADEIITAKKNGEDTTAMEKRVNEIVYGLYGVTDPAEIEAVEKR